jgi:hypothetical protein
MSRKVLERTLRRELSVAEAAEITGVAERDDVAWMRARRAGRGEGDQRRRKRHQRAAASRQVQYAVALYRDRYRHLSAPEFVGVLRSEHGIVIQGPGLHIALRKEGLIATPPVKPWRLAAAGIVPLVEVPVTASTGQGMRKPPPVDPLLRLGRELQALTDRVDRLNAQARDRIVDWRRGAGPLESAIDA